MVAAILKVLILNAVEVDADPGQVVRRVNRRFAAVAPAECFATLLVARWCHARQTLWFASAGHEAALLLAGAGPPRPLDSTGTMLGVLPDGTWEAVSVPAPPGAVLVGLTDGVTEAMDADGTQFGRDRLGEAIAGVAAAAPDRIVAVDEAVRRHLGGLPPTTTTPWSRFGSDRAGVVRFVGTLKVETAVHRPVSFGILLALGTGCAVFTRPAAAEPVDLTEVRADGLEAALDAQKGKVVLVDFWAAWCGPCVKKFPRFVETGKKYKGKGLVCVSVNMDKQGPAKGYDRGAVLDFLKAKEAAFPNYVLLDHEDGAAKIERRFGLAGGVPFVALFGRDGGRVWDSEAEPLKDDELDKRIEAELAK